MSEFDSLAEELVEEARNEEARQQQRDLSLIGKVLEIYDQKFVAELLRKLGNSDWTRETLNRWINGKCGPRSLTVTEASLLERLLPQPPANHPNYAFRFIDLFAGIGGIRHGFEAIGGQCVFTSEWNSYSVKTYKANWYCDPEAHIFNSDIRDVTLSHKEDISEEDAYAHIDKSIPDHDVLLAGFHVSPLALPESVRKTHLAVNTVLNVIPRGPYSLMWLVSSWQKNRPSLYLRTSRTSKATIKGKLSVSLWIP
jgi:DNA (cytosine-5)-methyltransferase 1